MTNSDDITLPPGREVGAFQIEGPLGRGNMGVVYKALQVNLRREVALKILPPAIARDDDFLRAFFREAQAAAAFTHQNIVQAFDVGKSDDGLFYFAMELVDGGDIAAKIKQEQRIDAVESLKLLVGVADGLDYGSQARRLTHGDLKPANILLTRNGKAKLADLGLARMGGEIDGESDGIMLTPLYASPEMIQNKWEVGDPRADIYSFGATLYHMIAGHPPFEADDYQQVMTMQQHSPHRHLVDIVPGCPAPISRFVDHLLEKKPEDRPQTWKEVKSRMDELIADPTEARKRKPAGIQIKGGVHYTQPHHSLEHEKAKKTSILIPALILAGLAVSVLIAWKVLAKPASPSDPVVSGPETHAPSKTPQPANLKAPVNPPVKAPVKAPVNPATTAALPSPEAYLQALAPLAKDPESWTRLAPAFYEHLQQAMEKNPGPEKAKYELLLATLNLGFTDMNSSFRSHLPEIGKALAPAEWKDAEPRINESGRLVLKKTEPFGKVKFEQRLSSSDFRRLAELAIQGKWLDQDRPGAIVALMIHSPDLADRLAPFLRPASRPAFLSLKDDTLKARGL
ncbi:MAG: hypothetical protein RL095_688 [Verrucomicrobiota bacterium]|jgi:serine/threonine protein kinase